MNGMVEVPRTAELEEAPQSAILAVLEHALLVGRTCLIVEHPCIGQLGECYEGRLPPRYSLLAQLIVDRCSELSELIGWYRRSCPRSLTHQRDDDELAEDEPF